MNLTGPNRLSLVFVALAFALAAAFYIWLPELVPNHWNASGHADRFTAKPWGAFLFPLVMLGVYLLFRLFPRISPRGFRIGGFQRTFDIVQTAIIAYLFLVTVLVLLAGIGAPVPMVRAIQAGVGLLWIVAGNFLGKFTKNFFVGIRTPWTLASDEVWLRTHRLGGRLFVLAGVVAVVSGLLGGGLAPMLTAVALAAVIPVVYSYFIYRRIEGFKNGSQGRP